MYNADQKDILLVKTLGEFKLSWNGKTIGGGSKARNSHFTRLVEILIHFRDSGVTREELESALFEDSKSWDTNRLLRSVIYNAEQKLRRDGLPEADYIVLKKDKYFWTDEIAVVEDTEIFKQKVEAARAEADTEAKTKKYIDACYTFTGEFLPNQTRLVWVTTENLKYTSLFRECVSETAELLTKRGDYQNICKLGKFASIVQPLEEWEKVTMDAYIAMEDYESASRLFESATELYREKLGIKPTFADVGIAESLADKINHRYADADQIIDDIMNEGTAPSGGIMCSFPVFKNLVIAQSRYAERTGMTSSLMVCTLLNSKGLPMGEGAILDKMTAHLKDCICRSVRKSDIVCQYGRAQYVVLLAGATDDAYKSVRKRINRLFGTGKRRVSIRYSIRSLNDAEGDSLADTVPDKL